MFYCLISIIYVLIIDYLCIIWIVAISLPFFLEFNELGILPPKTRKLQKKSKKPTAVSQHGYETQDRSY